MKKIKDSHLIPFHKMIEMEKCIMFLAGESKYENKSKVPGREN